MKYLFITLIGGVFAIYVGTTAASFVSQSFEAASNNLAQMGR